jgi:hypothetical protein
MSGGGDGQLGEAVLRLSEAVEGMMGMLEEQNRKLNLLLEAATQEADDEKASLEVLLADLVSLTNANGEVLGRIEQALGRKGAADER